MNLMFIWIGLVFMSLILFSISSHLGNLNETSEKILKEIKKLNKEKII